MSRALILDTNVLVSAALKPESDLARIVERVLLRQVPIYVCPSIVLEYLAHFPEKLRDGVLVLSPSEYLAGMK